MGNFAIGVADDGVEACLSAARVNIRLFEEDLEAGRDSIYLLDLAISALQEARVAGLKSKQTVAKKIT